MRKMLYVCHVSESSQTHHYSGHPTSDDAARDAIGDSESAAHQMVSRFNFSLPLVFDMNARLKWSRERRRGVTIMSDDHC